MSDNGPAHFVGVPKWVKIAVVFAALLLGALSIGLAWKDASEANRNLAFGQKDVEAISSIARVGQSGTISDQTFVVHVLNVIVHRKAITNHQALGGLAIGAGSAFLAIGFALFLLGADGAFQIQYEGKGDSKLAFYATAPGLLCFMLSASLIAFGATRKHEIQLGDFPVPGDPAVLQPQAEHKADQPKPSQTPTTSRPKLGTHQPEPNSSTVSAPAETADAVKNSAATAPFQSTDTWLMTEICIDRVFARDLVRPALSRRLSGGASSAVFGFRKLWINGSRLRVRFLDGDPEIQAKVRKYAAAWSEHANI